jgi:16S rRNA (cytidine1402-2'-O)-methyltransferase
MPAKTSGTLSIVATPIGNPDDISLRAINTLRAADVIICEELRVGTSLLKRLGIEPKEILLLNEHNEEEQASQIALRLVQGQNMALISDTGTPVFADPGSLLISIASGYGVPVVPIPGANSIIAALSILDFKLEQFVFGGFLPREPEKRRAELTRLRGLRMPVVLMDTPYRLGALLEDVAKTFGPGQPVTVACDLTQSNEIIYRGSASSVRKQVNQKKAEFVLIVHGPPGAGGRR